MIKDVKYKVEAGFFDSISEDRTYSADDMNRPYRKIISDGIFATPEGEPSDYLQVFSAANNMNVIVSAGFALIGGKWFENPSDLMITISQNTEILTRIDSIVAQVDKTQAGREGSIVYRQGTASSNPVHPDINTETDIKEYRLADIIISPSCIEITQDLITDCRGSSECPWVTSLIKQVDTSTLYAQWQEAYKKYYDNQKKEHDEFFSNAKDDFNTFKTNQEEDYTEWFKTVKEYCTNQEKDFDEWFETIKGKLSGDIALELQNQINNLNQNIDDLQEKMKPNTFTIETNSWSLEEGLYTATIEDRTVGINDMADVSIDNSAYSVAEDAGVKSYTTEIEGGIKLYADSIPSGKITGKYIVNRGVANG